MKEMTITKVLNYALIGIGLYVGYKYYKTPGFWSGVAASALIFGFSVKIYNKA